jgi:hypothetical protein
VILKDNREASGAAAIALVLVVGRLLRPTPMLEPRPA